MGIRVPEASFWAKLGLETWHPLSAHLADVGAVTQCLLDGRSVLAMRLASALNARAAALPEEVRRVVVYLACLHDIGKVHHGFQDRRHDGHAGHRKWRGHVRPLLDSSVTDRVPELRRALRDIARLAGGTDPLFTAICHHGRPYTPELPIGDPASYWRASGARNPLAELRRLDALAQEWCGVPPVEHASVMWTPEALHLLAGIITLADWIGSSECFFAHAPEADAAPEAYWRIAQQRASEACDAVGLRPRGVSVASGITGLAQLFPQTFPTYPPTVLQRHIAEMPLPDPGTRILVESDTGSGKTEAALTLFARLRAAGRVDGLYFALPTRATASAMEARVRALAERLYGAGTVPSVELATGGRQGGATSDPIGATAAQLPDEPESLLLERWTSRSTRHAMAAEVVVGTVDQILLAALAARHAHLRLAGLVRLLLVVDEVHAYDRYMTTALRTLVQVHTRTGGVVLFMSATLASETRALLGDDAVDITVPPQREVVRRPYPSLSMRAPGDHAWREIFLPAAADRAREVRWQLAAPDDALGAAISAARAGARAAVLRNTVRDARETLARLSALGAGDLLWRPAGARRAMAYHARYTTADRLALDAAVLRSFGQGEGARGTILVTTQVAEQSLDLDFDLLVTDLCPVDVLLQRLGRVHRHRRADRAGYDTPTVVVIEPTTSFAELVLRGRHRSTHGHGTVYRDLGDLELTRRLVATRASVALPASSRELVESVYHPDRRRALADENEGWAAHLEGRDGDDLAEEMNAHVCTIRFDLPYVSRENAQRFGQLADADGIVEARVRTRLGDDRIRIALPAPVPNCIAAGGPRDVFVDLDVRIILRAGAAPETLRCTEMSVPPADGSIAQCIIGPLLVTYDDRGWAWATSPR